MGILAWKRSIDTGPSAPCNETLKPAGRDSLGTSALRNCWKASRLCASKKRSRKFVCCNFRLDFKRRSKQAASSTILPLDRCKTTSPSQTPRKTF
eukprot:Skav222933  [mRNA]  locus=scaffold1489:420830:421114:- [translate_table: standard]